MSFRIFGLSLFFAFLYPMVVYSAGRSGPPESSRIEYYKNLLPESPRGVGATIADRKAWEDFSQGSNSARKIIDNANAALKKPMPELTDESYLDFSRTGNRDRGQAVIGARRSHLQRLVLGECVENQGRFLPAIEETIRAFCAEKSWLLPAHDRALKNFNGEIVEIDLASSDLGWQLALVKYWLGEKLSPEIRQLLASELDRRIFKPFTGMVNEGKPRMWWLTTTNNWNAVCLAGVTCAALTEIESRERRAFFVAAAEKFIESFLDGFTPDGYCSEGIGYWNYGFGRYLMLVETVKQATGGKVDWMSDPRIQPIAMFGRRMEILPGIYPAFADCHIGSQPDPTLMNYLSRRFGWGLEPKEKTDKRSSSLRGGYAEIGLFGFPNSLANIPSVPKTNEQSLRDWFSDAGILICRPKPGNRRALGAALKGGHNDEHHNHNDVGSFVVALGSATPLLDPGSEIYTSRTFSNHRYDSNVLNSFGHPVPRVAGTLQVPGRQAKAKIVKTAFSEKEDTLVLDIASAYKVESLKKLERTFIFSREGSGKLTVIDEVEFSRPESFGVALITYDKWKKTGANLVKIGEGNDAVEVKIDAQKADFRLDPQEIKEDLPRHRIPLRLGVDLEKPVLKAKITSTITPAE